MKMDVLGLITWATEEFVPPTDWRAQISTPAAILIFFGSIFLLLRSNLGTRRAYLVEAACFFGFMVVISLFWAFGAPGTVQYTGPQNLPGQALDYYLPKWVPFAEDSTLAEQRFSDAVVPPGELQPIPEVPEDEDNEPADVLVGETGVSVEEVNLGIDEVKAFFADAEQGGGVIQEEFVSVESGYTQVNDIPVLAVTYQAPLEDNPTEADPDGETYTAYAFFDFGFPLLPSLVFIVLSFTGFALHVALLIWDENREKREREAARSSETERVPAAA